MRWLALLIGLAAMAQETARPAFEVISVKPATPEDRHLGIGLFVYAGGRIHAANYTLTGLIYDAYNTDRWRIVGAPAWVDEDRFDVEAKPAASSDLGNWVPESFKSPPNPEMRLMLQSLLADRFQLKAHFETRKELIYSLVVAKGGPHLKPPADKTVRPFVSFLPNGLSGQNATVGQLVERLEVILRRPVLNHTGIEGSFDFQIEYPPEDIANNVSRTLMLSAIQQVGLKLDTQPGEVQELVVDSARKPGAN